MFRPFDKIQNLFPIFAETETQMNTAHILNSSVAPGDFKKHFAFVCNSCKYKHFHHVAFSRIEHLDRKVQKFYAVYRLL